MFTVKWFSARPDHDDNDQNIEMASASDNSRFSSKHQLLSAKQDSNLYERDLDIYEYVEDMCAAFDVMISQSMKDKVKITAYFEDERQQQEKELPYTGFVDRFVKSLLLQILKKEKVKEEFDFYNLKMTPDQFKVFESAVTMFKNHYQDLVKSGRIKLTEDCQYRVIEQIIEWTELYHRKIITPAVAVEKMENKIKNN